MLKNSFNIVIISAWILAGGFSIFFFLKRDQFGNYTCYSSYNDLYHSDDASGRSLTKWQRSLQQYSDEEKKAGKKFSAREAGINENEPDFSKSIKIGIWLLRSLWDCPAGKPPDSLEKLRPLELYKEIKVLQSPIWCGTYGALYLFFCSCNEITCRYIESTGGPDNHILNECYIPELKQWIIVDLTHKIIYALDDKGKYLNAGDVINMYKENRTDRINVFYLKDSLKPEKIVVDSIKSEWAQYLSNKNTLWYYYLIDLKMVYTPWKKIMRYLFPVNWYEVYLDKKKSNMLFFIRSSLVLAWLFLSIFIILKFFIHKRHS